MGFIKGLAKAGVAKRLFEEARKPQNQQRAKDLYAKVQASRSQRPAPSTRKTP